MKEFIILAALTLVSMSPPGINKHSQYHPIIQSDTYWSSFHQFIPIDNQTDLLIKFDSNVNDEDTSIILSPFSIHLKKPVTGLASLQDGYPLNEDPLLLTNKHPSIYMLVQQHLLQLEMCYLNDIYTSLITMNSKTKQNVQMSQIIQQYLIELSLSLLTYCQSLYNYLIRSIIFFYQHPKLIQSSIHTLLQQSLYPYLYVHTHVSIMSILLSIGTAYMCHRLEHYIWSCIKHFRNSSSDRMYSQLQQILHTLHINGIRRQTFFATTATHEKQTLNMADKLVKTPPLVQETTMDDPMTIIQLQRSLMLCIVHTFDQFAQFTVQQLYFKKESSKYLLKS